MRVLDSPEGAQFNGGKQLGCCDMLAPAITMARAHPHMPRRRKSMSPLRASSGSACPSAARRRVSYWVTMLVDPSKLWFDVISEFFLGPPARSSSGVHRARISGGSASPARAPEWARQQPVVLGYR